MRKNTIPPDRVRNGSIAFVFCLCVARKDNGSGVKDGATLQIYNFSDRREIAALYQANARPADIARRLCVTTATIYRGLKHGETVGEDAADSTGEFQAVWTDLGGRYARRFRL